MLNNFTPDLSFFKQDAQFQISELQKQDFFLSRSEIARRLFVSEGAIRKWLKKEDEKVPF